MRAENECKVINFFKSNDKTFLAACEKAGLKATRRQAAKWLKGKGKAFKSK